MPDLELEAALLAEAPKQWDRFQQRKLKRSKGKAKWQREIEEIDERVADAKAHTEKLRRQYDPELMHINANLDRKLGVAGGLHCPKCGEPDRGNKMNEKPWCMKCNIALESPFLVKKHRLSDVRMLPKSKRLDVTFRGLDE